MRTFLLAVAGMILAGTTGIEAQSLKGPSEQPPPDFTGQQYTDSAGCVFLRAGVSGRTTWVARVGADRRQLCGYPPSLQPPPATVVAAAPAPEPEAVPAPEAASEAAPATVTETASATAPVAPVAPRRQAAPAKAKAKPKAPATAPVPAAAARTAGCPETAPYGARVTLADGQRALVCVRSPDRLDAYAARVVAASGAPEEAVASGATTGAPISAAGIGPRVACPPSSPYLKRIATRDGGSALICAPQDGTTGARAIAPVVVIDSGTKVPKGYRLAWTDGRLNPQRGQGTAAGQVAQDQVWTRDVPAEQVAAAAPQQVPVVSASNAAPKRKAGTTLSASATPRAPKVAGQSAVYVQVGSFGVPANAENARGRLAGLGLPVAGGKGAIGGKPVQVVFAGPFGSRSEAQAALAAARRAGFGDAFIR